MTTVEQLLLIVDRAERGSMLAEEAVLLRAGIRRLAREAREGRCTAVSRPNSPSRSTGATGAESASEARGGFDPKPRPKGDEMSETELLQLQAELDQLNRDCDARDETIRHLDAGLTHEREQVARLEAELVAARSAVDRVREAAQWGSRNYPGLRALNDRLATALDDPPAGETSCRPRCDGVGGVRGLLEHVGIDTSGRDITVAGRLVDAAPPAADETPAAAARIDQAGVNAAQGFLLLVDEFQQVMARVAVQLAEAPEQVVALQTPKQRALDILAPHLDDEPLYHPHA